MSNYTWALIAVLAFVVGVGSGWNWKSESTSDRYLSSLAERHEATARYYNERTDQMVRENERIYRGK